jgi:hypothetical protein
VTSLLVGGAIKVHWGQGTATLAGPRVYLEVLRRRLRMDEHIRSVRQTVADSWVRQGRRLLKRVEVNLRVPPDRWQDVYEDVIEVLAHDGARVVCVVGILAQSDAGIVRDTVDVVIRDRLRQKNLDADFRVESCRRTTDPMIVLPDLPVPAAN